MTNLSLHMLGTFRATYDDASLTSFRTKKVQALLVYLAAESEPQPREALMELLWPGLPARSARVNLRQIVYLLRQAMPSVTSRNDDEGDAGPLLVANRQVIRLNPDAVVTVDTSEFESLLDKSASHDHLDIYICPECHQDLSAAVALYRGPFLTDFYVDDSDEFEEWAHAKRAYFRRRVLDALTTLTRTAIRQQAYARALDLADRQLQIDNLSENAYRQKMEALVLNGRRREALDVYAGCRQMLSQELAMTPSARTTELYEQILAGDSSDARSARSVRGYELQEQIDEGAFGSIHRAIQSAVGREVVVKVIRRQYANDPEFIRRFEAEAQIIARLEHPHIVPLYDYWRDPDGAYLVMRYLREGSLLNALNKGTWTPARTTTLLDQISSALAAAHRQGVVHRDIKPGNILLDDSGNSYLSDFGIAKDLGREAPLTADGTMIGTLDYISPEQILHEEVTPQADIYSLGAVLYETMTGEKPFGDVPIANLIYNHLNEPIPLVRASRADVPADVDAVLQKATAKRPADRFDSVLEMAVAYRSAIRGEGTAVVSVARPMLPPAEVYNPYKGLRAFQEADADDFFGRDALVRQLVARLDPVATVGEAFPGAGRFLAVVGPSGSGKSSVVRAGLIPALRDGALPGSDEWFIAEMVPGTRPLEELAVALWPVAVDPPADLVAPLKRDTGGLLRTVRRILPRANPASGKEPELLLVIDQFEELFTLVDSEERRAYFLDSLLKAITAPRSPLRVIITLRADFYDRPLQRQRLAQLLKTHTEIVLPLNNTELTWAIREPASRVGVRLEEGLVSTIIADVSDQPGALPLLQYAMAELFDARQGDLITRTGYTAIGGVLGALGRRGEEIYQAQDVAGREATRQLFLRLVTLGEGAEDTRRRVLRSELEALHPSEGSEPSEGLFSLIDAFGQHRLLTFDRDPVTRVPTVEVAHEALLREWPRLRGWLDESRHDVRMQRLLANAAAEWRGSEQDASYLLRGARLDQFDAWMAESDLALTNEERDFLDSSLAERKRREAQEAERVARETMLEQRSRRFLRALVGVFALAAVVALLLAGFAFNQRDNATARELAASALVSLEEDPERSILLALRSLNLAYTPEGEEVLRQGMVTSRVRLTIPKSAETVRDVIYTPDGNSIIGLEDDDGNSFVMVWDAASGELLRSLSCGESCVGGTISPDGNLVAAADEDYNIVIVDLAASFESGSPQIRYRLVGHTGEVLLWAGVFSADGTRLATTSWDKTLKVWDLEEGQLLYSVEEPALQWLFVPPSFSPDGSLLTTSALVRSVEIGARIFDADTGELLLALPTDQRWPSFSPDGQRVVTHSLDGSIVLWDVEASLATGIAQEWYSFQSRISGFSSGHPISPDGTYLFEDDGSDVVLWRLEEDGATEAMRLSGHGPGSLSFPLRNDFHPDGRQLVTGGSDGIRVWDISSTGEREALAIDAHQDEIRYLALNRDGTHLATASRDGTARLWNARSGERLQEFNGHQARVHDVDFSPDGNRLVTASDDRTARVWDIVTGEELAVLEASDEGYDVGGQYIGVMSARFSPDGRQIVTAGADGTVRFWDAQTYEPLQRMIINPRGENEHPRGVTLAIFSPDGSTLAAATDGGDDAMFKVWDNETGDVLLEQVLGPRLFGLDFSPDGRRLAVSSCCEGLVQVWDVGTGEQLLSLPPLGVTVREIFFGADGSRLITLGGDDLKFWDATSGELLQTFNAGPSFDLSPNESRLFIGSVDGQVRVFLMDIDELIALAQSRLTRSLSEAECRRYLHLDACPAE